MEMPMCPKCGNCAVVAVSAKATEKGPVVRVKCIQCGNKFEVAK